VAELITSVTGRVCVADNNKARCR